MGSIEEKVEDHYKKMLDNLGVRYYSKTEKINDSIENALKRGNSKSGGSGMNYPDIKLLLEDNNSRRIPVMIEAKGGKNKLEKLDKNGEIVGITYRDKDGKMKDGVPVYKKGDPNYTTIQTYAINGALHYGKLILSESFYEEVIIVGINATTLNENGDIIDPECKGYYLSKKNNYIPKLIKDITEDNLDLFKKENLGKLFSILDTLNLTEKEIETLTRKTEIELEEKVKHIHQSIYDDTRLRNALTTNEKLYLFCGLIMSGLKTQGVKCLEITDFESNDDIESNDGVLIVNRIKSYLRKKHCSNEKIEMILNLLSPVFFKTVLWKPQNGESLLKVLYQQVKTEIIPCLESDLHLDFTGRIFNSLNDWVGIENDVQNDVVFTPSYVTKLMVELGRTTMNSYVLDKTMGSGGFLVAAMECMIKDTKNKIVDQEELEKKIKHIKEHQLLGIEILGNIYILAVLNMILMGDGSSNIINEDSHKFHLSDDFPANVFLLNPPYGSDFNGLGFVEEGLNEMKSGYGVVLIQDSTGNGKGVPCTTRILKNNTLEASIKMPQDLFSSKASVGTCIFVFKVGRPHEEDDIVTFINFSKDGYTRKSRKKCSQEVNLQNTDHAVERYEEIVSHVLGKKPKTEYYTEENGTLIRDTISLNGDDWLFNQHVKYDNTPTAENFKKTVENYLSWKVNQALKGDVK